MKRIVFIFFAALIILQVSAQRIPTYWKDRAPSKDYWQQDVAYTMEVTLHDSTNIIEGTKYRLEYTNNSPDELTEIYFHLFSNAFQPDSYYDNLWKGNGRKAKFGKKEAQGLGTAVTNLEVEGRNVTLTLDNTILQVKLDKPIKPNETAIITMNFKTYFDNEGSMRRRMKFFDDGFGNKHYDAVHWYPSIACYDRKFGWTTDQHLDKEFYHDFGSFDVKITLPEEYILDGTGILQNKNEVLPPELMRKIAIENFKDKPFGEAPSVIISKGSGKTKTWHLFADLVHNFVFTADPTYRMGIEHVKLPGMIGDGIVVHSLAQEPHAAKWQKTAKFCKKIIEEYSSQFGRYAWPKIIAADARDGMEYPMITIAGGNYPGHQSLLAHEIGHMWYYGMVGSNETYRAMMDEGFTQFMTVWFMDKVSGQNIKSKQDPKLGMPSNRYWRLYYPYLNTIWDGYDNQLNTHSSDFHSGIRHGGSYGLVYYKTGVMLFNLKYVLGDKLFDEAMLYYFDKWKFCHPYPEDFRKAIMEFTKSDLNWFFDQWMETKKTIDYAVSGLKALDKEGNYEITFERKGTMQMPIDFAVITDKNDTLNYHIPNTWFVKETNAKVLPKWYGWELLNPEYHAQIKIEGKIKNVIIDPSLLLADIDLRNNQWKTPLDYKISLIRKRNYPNWTKSYANLSPSLWYNRYDGLQIGLNQHGSYMGKDNLYDVRMYFNSGVLQNKDVNSLRKKNYIPISIDFKLSQSMNSVSRSMFANEWYTYNAGILNFGAGLSKTFRKQDNRNPEYKKIFINTKYLVNSNNANHQKEYLLYPDYWSTNNSIINGKVWEEDLINASINLGFEEKYNYHIGKGSYKVSLRTPGAYSDHNYSYAQIESKNEFKIFKKLELKARIFGRLGTKNTPFESSLYLSGANPEQMLNNDFTKSGGFFPSNWTGYGTQMNHLQMGGGMNLRGYAGYLAPEVSEGEIVFTNLSNSGTSVSFELDFDKFIPFKPKSLRKWVHLDSYLFSDVGVIAYQNVSNKTNFGSIRADAGIGAALTFKKLPKGIYKPFTIRFDMPLLVNRSAASNPDFFQMRYVIGIGRSF